MRGIIVVIKLQMENEELRSFVLDTLRETKASQFVSFFNSVAYLVVQKGLISMNNSDSSFYSTSSYALDRRDCARVQNILWDLIVEGIIRPGLNDGTNNDLPFFHVTEKGEEILKHGVVTPYDPDGYIKRLVDDIKNLDIVIIAYLNECLSTFRIGSLLSSTITLGVASEKAFLLLIDACSNAMSDPNRKSRFIKDTQGKMIKRQYDEFMKLYQGKLRGLFPGDINDDFETTVYGVFTMIRNYRNDAGHPTGRIAPREVVYANIQVFPTYLKKIYSTIQWLSGNSI